jgi:adenylate cyclase
MLSTLLGDAPELVGFKRTIIERTEGNPFFMEELVQALFDQGALVRNGTIKLARSLSQLRLQPTAQAVLAARIDRLPADEKELLQTLAVIGRDFPIGLIRRVVQLSDAELDRMLGDLQLAEFIYEQPAFPEAEYIFKHALTQEVAYNSVLTERRKLLHERVAAALESIYTQRLDDHFSELARHYRNSTNTDKAIEYLELAGRQAVQRSAYHESVDNLTAALELLRALPESNEREHRELALQIALAESLTVPVGLGRPEGARVLLRARDLCQALGDSDGLFVVLLGLMWHYILQLQLRRAREVGEQLLRIAEGAKQPISSGAIHGGLGVEVVI